MYVYVCIPNPSQVQAIIINKKKKMLLIHRNRLSGYDCILYKFKKNINNDGVKIYFI